MKLTALFQRPLQRLLSSGLIALLIAREAGATWSIVVVNTRTGEVCVASATCINLFNLKPYQAVIQVGRGCGAAQAVIDGGAVNRIVIWNEMMAGVTPAQIIQDLSVLDPGHQDHQYGIATMYAAPATFTGSNTSLAHPGVTGIAGDLRYAIQGNILAGDAVVLNAEAALLATEGDFSQKVMAAMEAARATGGDGRCSCPGPDPTACGAPPPMFIYSAYTAYICLARIGDMDGVCAAGPGCANGHYFLDIKSISGLGGPEPVVQLEQRYALWRLGVAALADQLLSTVKPAAQSLVADGHSRTSVDVVLRNIDGLPVTIRSALQLTQVNPGASVAQIGEPVWLENGHFSVPVQATLQSGQGRWQMQVIHEGASVRLYPDLEIRVDPLAELHAGFDVVSASAGVAVPLILNLTPAQAGAPYRILASASGTSPGILFQGLSLPLNSDFIFRSSYRYANSGRFQNTLGSLDGDGRAEALFVAPHGLLDSFIGLHFDWCAVVTGAPSHVTNLSGFDVGP